MNNYKICRRCVYDTSAVNISFDDSGLCNFCQNYDKLASRFINIPKEELLVQLDVIVSKIKRLGSKSKYDCILGLSGGVDSSYLAYLAKELGLRPLLVHFDNGWNSELAVKNIENIVKILGYDLRTYVFNWEEFKDLQRSYFLSGVVDIEVPTDYLIFAVLNKIASKEGIKYILSGYNYATEFGMPEGWNFKNKFDDKNLRDIHAKFGKVELLDFPRFGRFQRFYYEKVLGIETVALLNYIDYNKAKVKEVIKNKLSWSDYGGKHFESIFTRFYQGYVLPTKFGIDKRRAHWSALICSGQALREDAIQNLLEPPYSLTSQMEDYEYIIKKLGFTKEEFESMMKSKPVSHYQYNTENENELSWRLFLKLTSFFVKVRLKFRHIGATGRWK